MEIVLVLAIVVVLAWVVTAPLRRAGGGGSRTEDPRVADLEARKEALYRQIRDAELDRAQGKLSDADWRRADAELRRDAIAVLEELDRAGASMNGAGGEENRD